MFFLYTKQQYSITVLSKKLAKNHSKSEFLVHFGLLKANLRSIKPNFSVAKVPMQDILGLLIRTRFFYRDISQKN